MIKEIKNDDLQGLDTDGTSLLWFSAEWCGPCRMLTPIISELEGENPDIKIGKVNVDNNGSAARKYGVRGIPMLVFLKDGEVMSTSVGVDTKANIQAKLDALK